MRKIFYLLLVFVLVLFACSAGCTSSTTKQEVLTQEEFQEKMDARAATNTPTTVSTTKPTTVPTTIPTTVPTTVPTVRKTPTPTPTIAYQDGEFKFALLMSSEEIIGVLGDIGSDLENSRYNSFFADGVILKKTAREQKNLLSSYRVSSSLQDTKTYYLQALDYCISCGGNIETAGKYYREDNLDLFATYMEKATSDMKNIGYYISLATKSIK
jgi:hypothetical protein